MRRAGTLSCSYFLLRGAQPIVGLGRSSTASLHVASQWHDCWSPAVLPPQSTPAPFREFSEDGGPCILSGTRDPRKRLASPLQNMCRLWRLPEWTDGWVFLLPATSGCHSGPSSDLRWRGGRSVFGLAWLPNICAACTQQPSWRLWASYHCSCGPDADQVDAWALCYMLGL